PVPPSSPTALLPPPPRGGGGARARLPDCAGRGGVSPPSQKKNPPPPIGPAGLARIAAVFQRRAPGLPLCGIAGIDVTNATDAIIAGADGVAVISALSLAPDPHTAARAPRATVHAALAPRNPHGAMTSLPVVTPL